MGETTGTPLVATTGLGRKLRRIEVGTTGETGAAGATAGALVRAVNGEGFSPARLRIEQPRARQLRERTECMYAHIIGSVTFLLQHHF